MDKVGFTGSSRVGARIGELTGRHLQSACLELGGKNPMVVTPSADIDLAVAGRAVLRVRYRRPALHLAGHGDRARGRPRRVHRQAGRRRPGGRRSATRSATWCTDRCSTTGSAAGSRSTWAGSSRTTGCSARPAPAGSPRRTRARGSSVTLRAGIFYHPTIVAGLREDDALFREETFGPLIGLTDYRDLAEAIRLANAPGYGLSSAMYTRDPAEAFRLPPRRVRGHGQRQQLHLRRRGAPAVRRQRPVGQRVAPVRHLGARPVHPLAVDELGLLRIACRRRRWMSLS